MITEEEIGEIWNRETPDDEEHIRLNGKYVRELPGGCVTSLTRTMTTSTSPHSENTEL